MSASERDLYPDVMAWLRRVLRTSYPSYEIEVFDTSKITLSRFIRRAQLRKFFPRCDLLDIRVQMTAVLRRADCAELAIAEVQAQPVRIKDVGPFLVIGRLALPALALLLSPRGLSPALDSLLRTGKRYDVLDYGPGKWLTLGAWDGKKRRVDPRSVLPRGSLKNAAAVHDYV
jgi:hypothetical protein